MKWLGRTKVRGPGGDWSYKAEIFDRGIRYYRHAGDWEQDEGWKPIPANSVPSDVHSILMATLPEIRGKHTHHARTR